MESRIPTRSRKTGAITNVSSANGTGSSVPPKPPQAHAHKTQSRASKLTATLFPTKDSVRTSSRVFSQVEKNSHGSNVETTSNKEKFNEIRKEETNDADININVSKYSKDLTTLSSSLIVPSSSIDLRNAASAITLSPSATLKKQLSARKILHEFQSISGMAEILIPSVSSTTPLCTIPSYRLFNCENSPASQLPVISPAIQRLPESHPSVIDLPNVNTCGQLSHGGSSRRNLQGLLNSSTDHSSRTNLSLPSTAALTTTQALGRCQFFPFQFTNNLQLMPEPTSLSFARPYDNFNRFLTPFTKPVFIEGHLRHPEENQELASVKHYSEDDISTRVVL